MSQKPSHILENLQTALPAVVKAVKGGWDNIQNLAIKTNSSVSLPIWSCILNVTESSLKAEDAEEVDENVENEEVEEVKAQASRKGRKRVTSSDEDIEGAEKPRKRPKAADGMMRGVSISKKVEKEEEEEEEEDEDEEDEDEEKAKERASRKGRKRVTNSDEEMEGIEKPKKRSKAPDGMVRGASISKKEMRQKRSANTVEKKKRIVFTSKGTKSLKNAVLGKKVGKSQVRP